MSRVFCSSLEVKYRAAGHVQEDGRDLPLLDVALTS